MADVEVVEVGFSGGQVIAVRLDPDEAEGAAQGAREVARAGPTSRPRTGVVSLDLAQVVFVRTDAPAQTVGFSG